MRVISTNIAQPVTFIWNNQKVTTGIYKKPIHQSMYLGKEGVKGDEVSDRRVHGGEFKACYLYAANQYPFWKNLYPNLDWSFGMLGENITVQDLNETQIYIGEIYRLGTAIVQITQPREPCFKFAHKFGSKHILQQFINHGYPGTYVKVLEEGDVKTGDAFHLVEQPKECISVFQLFELLYTEHKNTDTIRVLLESEALPQRLKHRLKSFLK